MGIVPRYTYRRLAKLPSTADQLRRHTVLNLPACCTPELRAHSHGAGGRRAHFGGGRHWASHLHDRRPGSDGADGDRIEVSANDLVHIPAGVPYGMHTLGGTDWVYVVLQAPTE